MTRRVLQTPIGSVAAVADPFALRSLLFVEEQPTEGAVSHPILNALEHQLGEYFERERTVFTIPMELEGSDSQMAVWSVIQAIPYGESLTYGRLAMRAGLPANAAQAVGQMVGQNPIMILVPCHRVVGESGEMRGYAGGLPAKLALLEIESGQGKLF